MEASADMTQRKAYMQATQLEVGISEFRGDNCAHEMTPSPIEAVSGYSSNSSADIDSAKMDAETIHARLKAQVEYYFSPQNLSRDNYMVSKMNVDGFIPVSVIAAFPKVKKLTSEASKIIDAVDDSQVCELSRDRTMIKAGWLRPVRTLLILFEASEETTEDDIRALFLDEDFGILTINCDINRNWYIRFGSEEAATKAEANVSSKTLNGHAINVCLQSELLLPAAPAQMYGHMAQQYMPSQYAGYSHYGGFPANYGYYNPAPGWNTGAAHYFPVDPVMQQPVHQDTSMRRHGYENKKGINNKPRAHYSNTGSQNFSEKRGTYSYTGQHYNKGAGPSASGTGSKPNSNRRPSDRQHSFATNGSMNGVGHNGGRTGGYSGNTGHSQSSGSRRGGKSGGHKNSGSKKTAPIQTANFTAQDFPTLSSVSRGQDNSAQTHSGLERSKTAAHKHAKNAVDENQDISNNAGLSDACINQSSSEVAASGSWVEAVAKIRNPQQISTASDAEKPSSSEEDKVAESARKECSSNFVENPDVTASVNAESRPARGWESCASARRNVRSGVPEAAQKSGSGSEKLADEQIEKDTDTDSSGCPLTVEPTINTATGSRTSVWGASKKTFADVIKSEPSVPVSTTK